MFPVPDRQEKQEIYGRLVMRVIRKRPGQGISVFRIICYDEGQ